MQPNRSFGPYRVGRRLGRGGMAETFVATRDLGTGAFQEVCLKRMLPGLIEDEELARAFRDEARLAADLVHANIAALIDHGSIDETYYLALELVDGVDLRTLVRAGPLAHEFVAEIAYGLGHALDYAHALRRDTTLAGAVHRDISPSNVLLGANGFVKLADFGIAKVAGASHHTRTGLLKGKLPYLPPEYICGGPYSPRGDLFALGVTLFECVAGVRPFDGGRDVETLQRIVAGERRSLLSLAPDVPRQLAEPIEALLSVDPARRPSDARALLAMLADAAPPASTRVRLAERVRELQRRQQDDARARDPRHAPTERIAAHTGPTTPLTHDTRLSDPSARADSAGPCEITRTSPRPS